MKKLKKQMRFIANLSKNWQKFGSIENVIKIDYFKETFSTTLQRDNVKSLNFKKSHTTKTN